MKAYSEAEVVIWWEEIACIDFDSRIRQAERVGD